MAINYITGDAGLFTRLGRIVGVITTTSSPFGTNQLANVDLAKLSIINPFETTDLDEQVGDVPGIFEFFTGQLVGVRQSIAALAEKVFNERVTSYAQLS